MRTFNAIQMIIILLISPTLLSLCSEATFSGHNIVFWVGCAATLALFVWTVVLVRFGMSQ